MKKLYNIKRFSLQNLAAFLTVERMVGTVKSMDQLAQQSKVNYTVVKNSSFYEYFKVREEFFAISLFKQPNKQ